MKYTFAIKSINLKNYSFRIKERFNQSPIVNSYDIITDSLIELVIEADLDRLHSYFGLFINEIINDYNSFLDIYKNKDY